MGSGFLCFKNLLDMRGLRLLFSTKYDQGIFLILFVFYLIGAERSHDLIIFLKIGSDRGYDVFYPVGLS